MFIGDVRRTWCAMYQRLDGFHPIFTKSYLDEEKWRFGARYASSSALDYGGRVLEPRKLDSCTFFFKNLASLQSIQNRAGLSLIFWEHFSCVYAGACTGASCAPHVRAWQYLTTRTLGKPKVSRSEEIIPSTASKQALNGLFRGLRRRFIPHSTPRLRLVVPIVSET